MADISTVVRNYVLADGSLAALIGSRLYPRKPPQKAVYPLIVMTVIDNPPVAAHLRGEGSLFRPRVQFDSWATVLQDARALAGVLRARLALARNGALLPDDSVSPSAQYLTWTERADTREDFEEDISGGYWRVSDDYFIWQQTTPSV